MQSHVTEDSYERSALQSWKLTEDTEMIFFETRDSVFKNELCKC